MSNDRDHDADWPWTLYFNGEPTPRWANCWNLCNLLQPARKSIGDSVWLADYSTFCRLHDRMDLAHTVDSEEPDVFRICCITLLALLLRHEASVLHTLAPYAADCETTPESIFAGVRDGLITMHQFTVRDGFAFWSAGYDTDRLALANSIRRFRLPLSDSDRLEAPHIAARGFEASSRIRSLRSSLIELLATQHQHKEIRRFIHELPTNA